MTGEIIGLSSPGYWVWLGPALILVVAGLSVLIISSITRSSISTMAKAAGEVLSQAEGMPRRRADVVDSRFVTEGKAASRFTPNTFLFRLVTRVASAEPNPSNEEARTALDGLTETLIKLGIDPDDIQDETLTPVEGGTQAGLSIRMQDEERVRDVNVAALQHGFREDKARPREVFDIEDVQAMAGRKALARAIANVHVMQDRLGLNGNIGLVEAHLSVETPGDLDNLVVMSARATWRIEVAPLPLA